MDPSKQETTSNVNVNDPLLPLGQRTNSSVIDTAQDRGAVSKNVTGAVRETGATQVGQGVSGVANEVIQRTPLLPKSWKRGAAGANKSIQTFGGEVPPPDNRGASVLPKARKGQAPKGMDIFKTPKNDEQASALAQTIAILQSQRQLNA